MSIHVTMFVALAVASLPAAVGAQVTHTYQYDANGRLPYISSAWQSSASSFVTSQG